MDYLGDGSSYGVRITYAVEPEGLHIGTAGCLKLVEHLLDETFLIAQADTLTEIPLREAVDFHHKVGSLTTIVLTRVPDPSEYGVALLDDKNMITEFQEKPKRGEARSNLVSTGFYVMEPESIDYLSDNKWDFAKGSLSAPLEAPQEVVWFRLGRVLGGHRKSRGIPGRDEMGVGDDEPTATRSADIVAERRDDSRVSLNSTGGPDC